MQILKIIVAFALFAVGIWHLAPILGNIRRTKEYFQFIENLHQKEIHFHLIRCGDEDPKSDQEVQVKTMNRFEYAAFIQGLYLEFWQMMEWNGRICPKTQLIADSKYEEYAYGKPWILSLEIQKPETLHYNQSSKHYERKDDTQNVSYLKSPEQIEMEAFVNNEIAKAKEKVAFSISADEG